MTPLKGMSQSPLFRSALSAFLLQYLLLAGPPQQLGDQARYHVTCGLDGNLDTVTGEASDGTDESDIDHHPPQHVRRTHALPRVRNSAYVRFGGMSVELVPQSRPGRCAPILFPLAVLEKKVQYG